MPWMLCTSQIAPNFHKRTPGPVAFLFSFLLLCTLASGRDPAQANTATTFAVNSVLDEPDASHGDGICASTPSGVCTLRAAMQEANALAGADTITLPAGTHALTIAGRDENEAASGDIDILESVTLQGAGRTLSIVEANALDRAFQVFNPAVVTMADLAIQGGDPGSSTGASGGGITIASGSQLALENVTLRQNSAGDTGGGIYNNGGTLLLNRVDILANTAATAGGIRNNGSLTAYDATIAGNSTTGAGAGLYNTGALTMERVTISGNIANTNGGGLYLHSADPLTGLVTITNSTISNNQAKSFMGGGIWVYYQTELSLYSSTVAGNSAGQGGGIFNYHQQGMLPSLSGSSPDAVNQEGNIHLQNTIVANNTLANCGRSAQTVAIHSLGNNLDSGTTCEFAQPDDLNNTNPSLAPLADNGGPTLTMALYPGSLAIDAGDDGSCPITDQRGTTRPLGTHCDIGAYEANPAGEANLAIRKQANPGIVAWSAPLTYTLTITNIGPAAASAITVTDNLPVGVDYVGASGSGWSCGHAAGTVTCTRPDLAVGLAPAIAVETLAPATAGVITNTATVSAATTDPNMDDNTASVQTEVTEPGQPSADLAIAQLATPGSVQTGAPLTYTLSVTNLGPDTATAIIVTDNLPAGVGYVSASGSGWSCEHAAGTVTCTRSALVVGSAPAIIIDALAPTTAGVITNTATVSATTADPDMTNNLTSRTVQVVYRTYLPVILNSP